MNGANSSTGNDSSGSSADWELIADYVTGRTSADAAAAALARERTDPAFRKDVAAARLAWERAESALGDSVSPEETERAWARLVTGLESVESPTPIQRVGRASAAPSGIRLRRSGPAWRAIALAASIVVAVGIGISFVTGTFAPFSSTAAVSMRDFVAGRGERVAVTLPDGGRVTLAPGSTLRAPERFAGDERRVVLSGRAYFEVAHDSARPFIVESNGVIVRVLGTEFDLRAYGDAPAEVVVRSGRVAVRAPANATNEIDDVLLTAGHRAIVDAGGAMTVDTAVDVDALLSWTTGRITFERATLAAVVADLERWHDVTIELADQELAGRRLTAAFDNESLDIVLETIGELTNARVGRDGSSIVLTSR